MVAAEQALPQSGVSTLLDRFTQNGRELLDVARTVRNAHAACKDWCARHQHDMGDHEGELWAIKKLEAVEALLTVKLTVNPNHPTSARDWHRIEALTNAIGRSSLDAYDKKLIEQALTDVAGIVAEQRAFKTSAEHALSAPNGFRR